MFKIARTVKQIYNAARNIPKSFLSSINNGLKYCSQSKGYVEDASEEFSFLKAPRDQLSKDLIQDKFKAFKPNLQNLENLKSTQLLDSAEIRKLIYARFADEIAAKPSDTEENQNLETKSHATRGHVETFTTYNIADEFNDLREQGYNFKELRSAIINHNSSQQSENIEERNTSDNRSGKSLSQRMKELVVSGHISSYSGESGLKEEVEKVMHQKALVIEEFMQKVNERLGFVSVDNSVLLVDSENDEAGTDATKTDLLGEY
ncbi:hypothetical protein PQ676_07165 [Rickettsia felis]|uniref:Uncharacterized protein n=1 Tax=Rickettsia felis (strain ATCC VR-1525 / URRWXCal2) TaxID=315456 RepID=Q4UJJ1_RICFE|nr:hypothetical protein [Rickettsia felis]AAY62266.1 unknown [Rickettsia felis URRWXCal2]KHO02186.1 hypothetical protein JS55_07975 [Rickettsia felis str. LSU]KHO02388.1 hypothetical protein JS61_07655 [Rickettsia felis]MDE8611970.1 hypothetical protein [Rickettsia felis]